MQKVNFQYQHENTVAAICLKDGKGNVLDHIMMEELQQTFHSLSENKNLKLIILEGAGKHFCFGASVEEHKKEMAATMLRNFHGLFYTLRDLAVPTLAKVSGQCLGGGMELAIMCNFLFADQTAMFGQPEIVLGVFAPAASVILPEKIGLAKAEVFLLTGKSVSAEEAKAMGLIHEVFEDRPAMDNGTAAWIEKYILPRSASSLRHAVRATRAKFNHVLTNFLPGVENQYVKELMATRDANEGIHSFIEKRKPIWENN